MRTLVRRRSKKDKQAFIRLAGAMFERLGARLMSELSHEDQWAGYEHFLVTKAGVLYLRIENDTSFALGTIFGRFSHPSLAKQFVDCNPYSGKWNFHFFADWTPESAVESVEHNLSEMVVDRA